MGVGWNSYRGAGTTGLNVTSPTLPAMTERIELRILGKLNRKALFAPFARSLGYIPIRFRMRCCGRSQVDAVGTRHRRTSFRAERQPRGAVAWLDLPKRPVL